MLALLNENAPSGVTIQNLSDTHRKLTIAGPSGQDLMSEVAGEDILSIPYLGFEESADFGYLIFRQGFGGEFEFHLLIENSDFEDVQATIDAAVKKIGWK